VQLDISADRGRDFLEVCSSVDSEGNKDAARCNAMLRVWAGLQALPMLPVYGELLSVPKRDRMACVPRAVTTIQVVRVIKKYLADNPGKAHRPTRYIARLRWQGRFRVSRGSRKRSQRLLFLKKTTREGEEAGARVEAIVGIAGEVAGRAFFLR